MIITLRNSSCGNVMFSQVSVIQSTGGVHGRRGLCGRETMHGCLACLAQLDPHQTCKPVMVSVVSSNPTGGNFNFLRHLDANFVQKWQKCQICVIYVTWYPETRYCQCSHWNIWKGFHTEFHQILNISIKCNSWPLVVKVMAKYCISLNFRPSTMEFSTGHLVLCNHVNLRGCGWLKPDQTSSSQFHLV